MSSEELQLFIYQCHNGSNVELKCFDGNTLWATQLQMGLIFNTSKQDVSYHLQKIFSTHELDEKSVVKEILTTASDGKPYKIQHYNLDAIIAVGYRVNSAKATQFRIWATKILKEYLIKGFALDDERFKNGNKFDREYFKELLERVKSIRASERQIWMQITDIFAEVAVDYDSKSITTRQFFSMIQNKFHYAITGQTAPEIIYNSANHNKEHMGLQTWKGSPDKRIIKSDVEVAKNYLTEKQIKQLERNVVGFFDYLEDLIDRATTPFTMKELADLIDKFLSFREYKILDNYGSISREDAIDKAHKEYEEYNKIQKSHFEELKKIAKNQKQNTQTTNKDKIKIETNNDININEIIKDNPELETNENNDFEIVLEKTIK